MGKVICGCYNVTEEMIKEAIENGADTFEAVQKVTHIGEGCGECVEEARGVINLLLQKKQA